MAQTADANAGTLGHLTPDETRSLQEAWVHLLRLSGVDIPNEKIPDRKDELLEEFKDKTPEAFHTSFWKLMASEHPDATVLRFLRARKWDVPKAVGMLTSAVNWRRERRIDEDIIGVGESVALKAKPTTDDDGFIKQYRSGKSYIRGTDNENRPIHFIRSRLHDPNMQTPEAMEAFILHNIESVRMLAARANVEKACLIFDLGGFGLRNMDFHVIRFLVTVFEARYPETLGAVHVHKAPFVFWGIWSIVKRWLDPVIAAKITFTGGSDLTKYIPKENLQKSYGGKDDWEYKYFEPVAGENDHADDEKKVEEERDREDLLQRYQKLTVEWVGLDAESAAGKEKNAERDALVKELQQNYWRLDPYRRARTYYHRCGVLDATGKVDFKAAA